MNKKKLILIPGAWSNKSIWNHLKLELSKLGIDSQALTLSGLEQNDKTKNVDLRNHVNDVVTFLNSQSANGTTLVGHSYSGFVASLAAEQIPDKVAGLIFIEAFLPENGKSLLEIAGLDVEEETKGIATNNGIWQPPTKNEISSQPYLSKEHIDFLVSNMLGHPGKTVTDKAEIRGENLQKLPVSYIGGNLSEKVKNNPNFSKIDFFKLDGGHWPMLTKPRELAEIIGKI